MEKGPFHRNTFDAKAALRIHVPMPLMHFNTKLKAPQHKRATNSQEQKRFL